MNSQNLLNVKETSDFISKNSEFVKINQDKILDFIKTVKPEEIGQSEFNVDTLLSGKYSEEQQIAFVFVYNSLN